MSHLYFPTEILERFCIDSFKNFSFSEDESKIITDVLLTSDKFELNLTGCSAFPDIIKESRKA